MTGNRERATKPEDLTRLFVELANAGDAEGLAALYEPDAVVAFPPGQMTVGRAAIRALYEQMLAAKPHFELEKPLPTLHCGDLALTSTPALEPYQPRRKGDRCWLHGVSSRLLRLPSPPVEGRSSTEPATEKRSW